MRHSRGFGDRPLARLIGCVLVGLCACSAVVTGAASAGSVRPSALAGTWYPAEPAALRDLAGRLLAEAPVQSPRGRVRALILPHAGYAYSGPTAAAGLATVRGRGFRRVLILAPSHRNGFAGLSMAEVDAFRTPLGEIPLDAEAVAALRRSDLFVSVPEAHGPEHSIEIQLPLLQRALAPGWQLIPVLVGQLSEAQIEAAADLLRPLADDDTLVLVSSDFTHYGEGFGYRPFPLDAQTPERIRALDQGAIDRIRGKDAPGFLNYRAKTGITVCGFRPIAILLRMLGPGAKVQPVAYAASGDQTGDWGYSVSYAALAITDPQPLADDGAATAPQTQVTPGPGSSPSVEVQAASQADASTPPERPTLTASDLQLLHRLATLAVEDAVYGPSQARDRVESETVAALPQRLRAPGGAFVTLKSQGELRGCIGTIEPREPLYLAVLANGDNAARRDPRFRPLTQQELNGLEIEVSVLTPLHPIPSWQAFKVGEQGIVLGKDGRRAVFLPEVATEQGWSREETLSHLALKAGLPADAWREGASFEVFESVKYAAPYTAPDVTGQGQEAARPTPATSAGAAD